jgi:cytochrome c-type biogenesis protein CcmH/NrfF
MNGSILFQNTLLVIIATLLLVIVIQNNQSRAPAWETPMMTEDSQSYAPSMGSPAPMTGHDQKAGAPMKSSMVFQALKAFPKGCDSQKILAECSSPAAEQVKNEILKMEDEGKGPRQIFDAIVAKWGEKVLTDQALQIRKMRVKGHGQ